MSDNQDIADVYAYRVVDTRPEDDVKPCAGSTENIGTITVNPPITVGNYGENLYFTIDDDNLYCPTDDHRIQNAVRLTPEGSSDE